MTVSELIEELRKYDGDMRVGTYKDELQFVKGVQMSTTLVLSADFEGDMPFLELITTVYI